MKTEIDNLIHSDKDENLIIQELNPLLQDCTEEDLSNDKNQTLFHLLIQKGLSQVLKFLFTNKQFIALAYQKNEQGQSLLHYAINCNLDDQKISNTTRQNILDCLAFHLPDLINQWDSKDGNTPLHLALILRQEWAVNILMRTGKINRIIANNEMKTVADIAKDDLELTNALLCIDLSQIKPFILKPNPQSKKIADSSLNASSSCSSLTDSASSSSENIRDISPKKESRQKEIKRVAFHFSEKPALNFLSQLMDLIGNPLSASSTSLLLTQFVNLCTQTTIVIPKRSQEVSIASSSEPQMSLKELAVSNSEGPKIFEDLIYSNPENLMTLNQVLQKLHPLVTTHLERYEQDIYNATQEFELLLQAQELPKQDIKETPPDSENNPLSETLWSIISGRDGNNQFLGFDHQLATYQLLGLVTVFSPSLVFNAISQLMSQLDSAQKFAANYLIWQLILNSPDLKFEKMESLLADFYVQNSVNTNGYILNLRLANLYSKQRDFYDSALITNFQTILKWQQNFPGKRSFDTLVDSALEKKAGQRPIELEQIAKELTTATISFYQDVEIFPEFSNSNWLKPDDNPYQVGKKKLAPHIDAQTELVNGVVKYFLRKIINLPENKITNALQLLLELAPLLYPTNEKMGETKTRDLNSLMIINSILGTNCIDRLTRFTKLFTPSEKATQQQISDLTKQVNNLRSMRSTFTTDPNVLPFLGGYLTSLTFAKECGNQNSLIDQVEIRGKSIASLIGLKNTQRLKLTDYLSNLPQFINELEEVNEESLYFTSIRIQPRKIDEIELSSKDINAMDLLNNLDEHYLKKNIIPSFKGKKKVYEPEQAATKLLSWYKIQLKSKQYTPDLKVKMQSIFVELERVGIYYKINFDSKKLVAKIDSLHTPKKGRSRIQREKSSRRLSIFPSTAMAASSSTKESPDTGLKRT